MIRRLAIVVVALAAAACGSKSPTAPSSSTPPPPTAPPAPVTVTLTGRVSATSTGLALAGLALELVGQSATTDAAGAFRYTLAPGSSARLSVTGAGIVPRSLLVAIGSSRDVAVDAISTAGFDLNFYRQMIRNGLEAPGALSVVRRWTRTPAIYLKTVDEAGIAIDPTTLDTIETTIADAVPRWTAGRLGTPTIERGTGSREGQAGWITIKFPTSTVAGVCGTAQIAQDGGWIEFAYTRVSGGSTLCRIGPAVISRRTIRHEIGHALGFRHTDTVADVMFAGIWTNPDQLPSVRELAAAAIAYQRPVGNLDPDQDPAGAVTLQPLTSR